MLLKSNIRQIVLLSPIELALSWAVGVIQLLLLEATNRVLLL